MPTSLIEPFTKTLDYETDKSTWIIEQLDDHYMSLRAEKIKREMNKKK